MVVVAVIAILASLLLPALSRAKQKSHRTACLSQLHQIGLAFTLYLGDFRERFMDRRDLKNSLPGGYKPWSSWPTSDPRTGWAPEALREFGARDPVWSCPAALNSPVGGVVQALQTGSDTNSVVITRYWAWRFDRPDDPVNSEDFWGKTVGQAIADLQSANDPIVGVVTGPCDVELVVDPYFPATIPSVDAPLKGRAIHPGGRNRVFLDGHVQYLKDKRTPL
jgi:prepilin-type processing-associated H-X9-DG protein